ncbi:MAG: alanine--tRNA ligase [Gammaproteobacteria bacterium]|nr:alanine--tRNA ligase [Gammaproteobacteria bacterium]
MNTAQIRQKFLTYFEKQGHTIVPSASLVPHNDKTLMFVNAGMVPFKDVFIGAVKKPYKRAVSSQRCVRAGGKHNDLENVGYTARHHTFFEMLGNFSFGDYFKSEAIRFAWEFLTKELKLPKEKLWVSVFEDDAEAEDIWINEIGFPKDRISHCGAKDNFWQMGDTGPCGPCSEIFYDHGEHIQGGPPGTPEEDGDRFIEIWNLVFMQFERQEDGTLVPLKSPGIDTGMGLERLAAVLQHVNNNYDIDAFSEITSEIVKLTPKDKKITVEDSSVRVIADHIRSTTFMVVDGITPSNEGRGYVLRRIIRRAIRHGHKIGISDVFFYKLVKLLAIQNKQAYPELFNSMKNVESIFKKEEKRFIQTLDQGMSILEEAISKIDDNVISGDIAFKLYDTFGFPLDLTADVAREKGLTIDLDGFDLAMDKQKERARNAGDFDAKKNAIIIDKETNFLGYESTSSPAKITEIIKNGKLVDSITTGDEAIIVMSESPFYAESGGQVGDIGILKNNACEFNVSDTQKQASGAIEHFGIMNNGDLKINDSVDAIVDDNRRNNIMKNHSATHLLHEALRQSLGNSIEQKGSLVDSDKLRFDFSFDGALTNESIGDIELIVNQQILTNSEVKTQVSDIESAKKSGARALFGEKYGDTVRVLSMGKDNFSVELCGGTHVKRLGDIARFKIISEGGIAAGIRRIEAVTGIEAYKSDKRAQDSLEKIASTIKTNAGQAQEKVLQLIHQQKELDKEISSLKKQLASGQGDELLTKVEKVNGINLLAIELKDVGGKELRDIADKLKDKIGSVVIVLAAVNNGKVSLISGVTKDLTSKYQAGKILNHVAIQIGGKGGGRPDMAQGGGTKPEKLTKALKSVRELI